MQKIYLQVGLAFLLLLLATPPTVSAEEWVNVGSGSLSFPGHVYKIECSPGDVLTGSVTWNESADLNVHIYRQTSSNTMSTNTWAKLQSTSYSNQPVNVTVNQRGTYYLKVIVISMPSSTTMYYSITVSSTSGRSISSYSYICSQYDGYTAIKIKKIATMGCQIKVKYNTMESISTMVALVDPSWSSTEQSFTNSSSNTFTQSWTQNGDWSVIFILSQNSFRRIYSYSYTILYNSNMSLCCSSGYTYNTTTASCQANTTDDTTTNSTNTTATVSTQNQISKYDIIVISVVVVVVGIFIVIAILCVYYRKCRKVVPENASEENYVNGGSIDQFRQAKSLNFTCSICLGEDAEGSLMLKCKHVFHKKCIQNWLKRSQICPNCRRDISFHSQSLL